MSDWRGDVRARLRGLRLSPERETEIVDELTQHLGDREADLLRGGVAPDQARRLVFEEIADEGGMGRELARLRQARQSVPPPPGVPQRARPLDQFLQDLRYGVRSLAKRPGFTAAAALALAIGIGATSAIFQAADAVLLRPMPFPHADRLFVLVSTNASRNIQRTGVAYADYTDWRAHSELFAGVALWRPTREDFVGDDGTAVGASAAQVTEDFFRLADVHPVLGRALEPRDFTAGAPPVIVITNGLWRDRFGGDPAIVGRAVRLGETPATIVGVLPPDVWPPAAQLFEPMPLPLVSNDDVRFRRDNLIFRAIGRLQDGVSPAAVDAYLAANAARLAADDPGSRANWSNRAVPLREELVEPGMRTALLVLAGAVAFVLLIACANVANLALVHGSGRRRELALRVSLGASRSRIVQQLVVESVIVTAIGSAAGAVVGVAIMRGLVAIAPPGTPFIGALHFDLRFVVWLAALAAVTTVVSGALPALSVSAVEPSAALHEGTTGGGSSRRILSFRNALVVAEVAAAVVLVTIAALLVRSFARLSQVDPGVSVDRLVEGRLTMRAARYRDREARGRLANALVARLEQEPDIARAALTTYVPAGGGGFGLGRVFVEDGHAEPPAGPDFSALWHEVTPGYFDTVGIGVREGRAFTERDDITGAPVIVVSESFARAMFGDASPIGHRIRSWRDENRLREIVGVVSDVKVERLDERGTPTVYVPTAQGSFGEVMLVARSSGRPPAALAPSMRRAVADVDPGLVVADVETLEQAMRATVSSERYAAQLLAALSLAALALTAMGVYGVTSYVFLLRRRELGIRRALGAPRGSLYRLVLGHGLRLAAAGLALGVVGAAAATRVASGLLFATSPADPASWAVMAAVILIATIAACLLPARRAAKADPMAALRAE